MLKFCRLQHHLPVLSGVLLFAEEKSHPEASGIAGVVGERNAQTFLLGTLEEISKRKNICESGVATISPFKGEIVTTKSGSERGADKATHWLPETFDCVVVVRNNAESSGRHNGHTSGIVSFREVPSCRCCAHRQESVQPQSDHKKRIAIVHEGRIANAKELRKEMDQLLDYKLQTHVDAELIAELIGYYIDKGYSVPLATKQTLSRLDGSWALAVIDNENPDEVIVSQNGSRLTVGIGEETMYVATEPEFFSQYTNRYISLQDGEFAIVRAKNSTLDLSRAEQLPSDKRHVLDKNVGPAPFKHWTLSEIWEQPESLARALGCGSRIAGDQIVLGGLDNNMDALLNIDHLTIVAEGSSLYAAEYGEKLMQELDNFSTVRTISCHDMKKRYIAPQNGGCCVISKTGESEVSQKAVRTAAKSEYPIFSVVNSVGSQVARMTKIGVYLNAGEEHGQVSTKTFSSQVLVMALISSWFAQYGENCPLEKRFELIQSINRISRCFSTALESHKQCKIAAKRLFSSRHCFIIGNNFAEPIAKEGSLLFNLLSDLNAEAATSGSVRHATLSLIEGPNSKFGRTPVIVLLLSDDEPDKMRITAGQLRASGAFTLVITDDERYADGVSDMTITIPKNGYLTALNCIVPLQLIAYELALLKSMNPDEVYENLPSAIIRHGSSKSGNDAARLLH